MKKKKFIIILLIVCLIALTGCTTKYNRDDISDYIEKEIGIKNFKLTDKPDKKMGDDGYEDEYWHVTYKDIEFDVINNYFWGMESLANRLDNNFDQNVLDYFFSKYNNLNNITYKKSYVNNDKTLICEAANEQKEIDNTKLNNCYNNIIEFVNTIVFKDYPMKNISVEITDGSNHVKWKSIYHNNKIKSFDEFKNS